MFTFVGLMTLYWIYDPTALNSLGALIPPAYFYLPLKILVVIFHASLGLVIITNALFLGLSITSYGYYFIILSTKELRLGRPPTHYRAVAAIRESDNLRIVYRSFQLLNANIMCFMGIYLVTANAIFMLNAIFCEVVLIRYYKTLHPLLKGVMILLTIIITAAWPILLELGRVFFTRGSKVLSSWKKAQWNSNSELQVMRRFGQSCPPIVIAYGRQFIVRRVSSLNYFRGVIRGTKRVLLATKH